jgi:outer membrane protein OmpA-like peptidoglycan-associated protein
MTLISFLIATIGWSAAALADDHLRGVISGRASDGTLVVQTDASTVSVVLADATKIRRVDGMRSIRVSSASLIPGLRVNVTGRYDGENHFVAERVAFSRSDLKVAKDVEAGITPTDQRSVLNQQRIEQHAQKLREQGSTLDQHGQLIETQRGQIAANADKIVATSGAVDATNARIGNLENYNVVAAATVYFANGKAVIAPKYRAELRRLAEQARATPAAVVQIQGFASAVGSDALNQQLSMKRADAVTAVLQQSGVAPTNVVVPAAMGTTEQVASNRTAKGQAQNRRAVVTLLQNKGITGK